MEKLFSYGTLQMRKVQKETFGRLLDGTKDVLLGYALSETEIKDEHVIKKSGTDIHPILKYTGNNADEVEGMVFEVTREELHQADEYEVKEYARTYAALKSGMYAWVYADANHINGT